MGSPLGLGKAKDVKSTLARRNAVKEGSTKHEARRKKGVLNEACGVMDVKSALARRPRAAIAIAEAQAQRRRRGSQNENRGE